MIHPIVRKSLVFLLSSLAFLQAKAQQQTLRPYAPGAAEVANAYQQSNKLDTALRNIPTNNDIIPFWKKDGTAFWYKKNLPNRTWEYNYVDAATGKRKAAFDHDKLAQSIEKTTGKKQNPLKLQFTELYFGDDGNKATIKMQDKWYQLNLNDYSLTDTKDTSIYRYNAKRPLQQRRSRWQRNREARKSPDGKSEIMIRGGNLFVVDLATKVETQLSTDGNADKPYGEYAWAPDGKNIVAYKIDPKEIKKVHYILSSVPGTTRGELKSREYAQPGDDFTAYQPYVFNVASKKSTKVDADPIDFFGAPELHWRNGNSRYYSYEKVDRGHQRFRVIEVDVLTGKTKNIIDEKTKTFIYESRIYTRYLPKTNEMLYTSEQDGWQHLYLVNTLSGKQSLITKGNYVVRDIDSIDVAKRQVWFKASGINAGEDPYFIHYYRIGFDGKGLVNLTPEKGNHSLSFSPDRKYYLDTYSQVNVPPVTELRLTATTKKVTELEHGQKDIYLATGVKLPEVFVAKARDGVTDIWGVVCFPSKMDINKTYPVIENIYAGPQDSFVPKNFLPASEMQSMAELGFIVVQIDGMGTANRSKAFHDVCWKNLADAGLPDRILWMKAMAKKYPNADITRVGVYGTSAGGQNSTGALLFHPEFYKAAVSACGCHDNRIDKQWWNEQWMGYPVGPHYGEQSNITNAAKLQGDLFLIVGEADENVPPESTYRLADALIKANKDFDILSIPGMGHSDGGVYGRRRKRDFFVKHLLNAEPPNPNVSK
ncbi:peptidase S9 [Pedobacter sp. Leaf216]|uniref:S9 family peptidase n=1 Tax=Pedobacter sp. Leaf216 TaxID=1735684 RepID=UPI0006F85008|nr:S9 family peptidase [Pedobacter sp. Leaf216]KQM78074.1 peptidase S9 [Pedobacter sp. Leaf216]